MRPQPVIPGSTSESLSNIKGGFTENIGQMDEGTFYCLGDPLSVVLGTGWVHYVHRPGQGGKGVLVRVDFPGANCVEPVGIGHMGHTTNVLRGNDPDGWVTGARSFEEVSYNSIWDGIDLHYRFDDGMLKYEFVVAPGADPSVIQMRYTGHDALSVDDASCDLVIQTPGIDLIDAAPIAYQEGIGDIPTSFRTIGDGIVVFDLVEHDPRLPLVIDPGLEFATYIGGSNYDWIYGLTVDDNGDIYVCGHTMSTDLPTTPGVIDGEHLGEEDAYVSRIKGDGTTQVFSTYLGSDKWDTALHLTLDDQGNLIITGATNGTEFPTTLGAIQSQVNGEDDAFIMSIDGNGTRILWSTLLGGSDFDLGWHHDIASNGDLFIIGPTLSHDFPMVSGCFDTEYGGDNDNFVARINHNGTELLKSTYIGGSKWDQVGYYPMEVDREDNVYISLQTESEDFPVTSSAYQSTKADESDCAVMKMDGNLTFLHYSTYFGGDDFERPMAITLNDDGQAIIAGRTWSQDLPTTENAWDRTYNWSQGMEGFIAMLDENGSSVVFSTYFGGEDDDDIYSMHLDDDGLLIFSMQTNSTRLPITEHAYDATHNGEHDAYIGVLDIVNQSIRYGSYLGGTGREENPYIGAVRGSSVYLVFPTWSDDFPTTTGALQRVYAGEGDSVLACLDLVLSDPVPSSSPLNLSLSLDRFDVGLQWDPPSAPGGFNIWCYHVLRGPTADNLTFISCTGGGPLQYNDVPPEVGYTYFYAIIGLYPLGETPRSNVVSIVYVTPPGPPTDLASTPGCQTVSLNWTPPDSTGGLDLLGYRLYRGTSNNTLEELAVLDLATSFEDDDVVNGVTYYYSVSAFNILGNSSLAPIVTAYPTGPPTAPVQFEAIPGDGNVTLSWQPPYNEGGVPMWGYTILRGLTPDNLLTLVDVDDAITEHVDTRLENGLTYHYAILAFNSLGHGPSSRVVDAMPSGLPDRPLSLVLTVEVGRVDLAWDRPYYTGGLPITSYVVYRGISEAHLAPIGTTVDTTYSDGEPLTGRYFYYAVSANNSNGEGSRTPAIEVWPLDLPGPTRDLQVTAGLGSVSLSWRPPEFDGGAEIIAYLVQRGTEPMMDYEELKNVSADTLSFVDSLVEPGTTYQYAVQAVTLLGRGAWGDIIAAVPYTLPSAPLDLDHSADEWTVTLTWSPPVDIGFTPIIGYRVYRGAATASLTLMAEVDATSFTDASVTEDNLYYYAVSAVNAGGEGPRTEAILVSPGVPLMPPGPPRGLKDTVDGTSVDLKWDPPASDGGAPVTGYAVLRGTSRGDIKEFTLVTVTKCTDVDLVEGETYFYAVRAINDVGMGDLSKTISVEIEAPGGIIASDSPVMWLAIVAVVLVALVAGAAAASEPFKYSLALLFLPLYTRIKRDQVLDNKNRYFILGIIVDRPGIHYNAIIQEFDVPVGVATHHLNVLERENYIRSVRDGRLKRFYSKYTKVPEEPRMTPEAIRKALLALVRKNPGISQMDIINELGIERDTVSYHLRSLVKEDALDAGKKGRYTVYTLNGRK